MNENKEGKTRMSRLSMSLWVLFSLLAVGCKPEPKPDVPPGAQYLKDNEDSTRASAEAILKSGLPYPNSQFETDVDEKGRQKQRLVARDMWLGPDRFVIPGEVVGSNPSWPEYLRPVNGTTPRAAMPTCCVSWKAWRRTRLGSALGRTSGSSAPSARETRPALPMGTAAISTQWSGSVPVVKGLCWCPR